MRNLWVAFALAAVARAGSADDLRIESHTCANGLEVLVVENHALPLVTIEIAVHNGSMTESPEYNGLSHLYEHMFFKANAAIPNQEAYLARTRELGMAWNGTTNTERVNYFFTTTTPHFDDAMVFMRDAIVSPLFDAKEFERERVVVTGEIDRNESNPAYYFSHAVQRRVWWKHPSYKDPLGNRETVLTATPEKMRTIQKRYYVPNNSALVVTGDVKAADVFAKTDRLYAAWERAEDPFVKYPLVGHPPIPATEVVVVEQPVKTVRGSMTWHGPSAVGPSVDATYAADLLGYAVQKPASKFQKVLVDSGVCVWARFNWTTQRNVGPITLSFQAQPEKVDACVKAAQAELSKMKAPDYFSDQELADAAFSIEVEQASGRERPSQYAHTITFWWASASLEYYRGYAANVRRATRADIALYLDTFVLAKPFVFGVLLSPETSAKLGLNRAHFESILGLGQPAPPAGLDRKGGLP